MAGIIKQHSKSPGGAVVTAPAFDFADMGQKAESYLTDVRARAAKIIADARAEADQIKQQAQAEGRQAALAAAEAAIGAKLNEQVKHLLPALESAAQQVVQAKQEWLRHWEHQAVVLASKIAAKVMRRELASQPEISLTLVREALELAAGCHKVTLHLHPADRAALGDRVQQLASHMAKLGPVHTVVDETISRGGCRVHTEFGVIDQQIESQLERIEMELAR
jgi:flagellar assembly protein FliH